MDALKEYENVTYIKGFSADEDCYEEALAQEALNAVKSADKVVICAGLPDSFESEGYDRSHMHLPECQNRLIREITAVQPETIVVLHNGSPVEMPWLSDVKGLLEAYLGGQAVGEAVADILFGNVNPSGKLAETIPYKLSDNPSYLSFGDGDHVTYKEGIFVGYRYYDAKEMPVAFPFGYGLSYTTFAYSNLTLDRNNVADEDTVTVTVDVTNTGSVKGKEIVQLYVSDLTGAARRPLRELKGYEKVSLKPGETKTVSFTLDYRSFAWYHTALHDWYAASGEYEIQIGASSRDIRLSEIVHLTTKKLLPIQTHLNTTLGELLSDERTAKYGLKHKKKMDAFFGGDAAESDEDAKGAEEPTDEAVGDAMGDAIAFSMPMRGVLSFGLCTKEELQNMIDEMNQL